MLVQLRQSGALDQIAALVVGAIRPVEGSEAEARAIADFIAQQTADLGIPVLSGIEVGHGTENFAIPLGARVTVDGDSRRMIVAESGISK